MTSLFTLFNKVLNSKFDSEELLVQYLYVSKLQLVYLKNVFLWQFKNALMDKVGLCTKREHKTQRKVKLS